MKRSTAIFIAIFLTCQFCFGQVEYRYSQPETLSDGWQTAYLFNGNVDSTLFYRLFEQLANTEQKIHSILLIRNGKIVLEQYFNKKNVDAPHDLRSVTKSILSLLIGICIDKGFVESVDDPILKYIKDPLPVKNPDPRKKNITIRHLLTMSTGLDCNDWDKKSKGQEDKVYKQKDWLQYTLDLPMIRAPGDTALYCSMGTVLLAEIISQASGMPLDSFATKYLFQPLDIENLYWGHTTTGKEIIPSAKRLYMTPRDMAKIGMLVLNNGKWSTEQIVSEDWIRLSTSPQTRLAHMNYGFLWWNIPFRISDKEINAVVATGNGGQYIMIFPDQKMIAVFTGGAFNSEKDKLPFAIVNEVLLPSLKN